MYTEPNKPSFFDQFKGGVSGERSKGIDPLTMKLVEISKQNPSSIANQVLTGAGIMSQPAAPQQSMQQQPPAGPAGLQAIMQNAHSSLPSVLQKLQAMQQGQQAQQPQVQAPPPGPDESQQPAVQGMAEGGIASLPIEVGQFAEGGVVGFDGGGRVAIPTMQGSSEEVQKIYDNPNLIENQLYQKIVDYQKNRPAFEEQTKTALEGLRKQQLSNEANAAAQLPYSQTAKLFSAAATPGRSADALQDVQRQAQDLDAARLGSSKAYAQSLIDLQKSAYEAQDPSKLLASKIAVDQALNPRAQVAEGVYKTGAMMFDTQQRADAARALHGETVSKAKADTDKIERYYSNRILQETNGKPETATPGMKAEIFAEALGVVAGAPRAQTADTQMLNSINVAQSKWDADHKLEAAAASLDTDPAKSKAFNEMRNIEFKRIEDMAQKIRPQRGGGIAELPASGANPTPAPIVAPIAKPTMTIPNAGDVIGGFKFKGGNPADKANWNKV